MPVSPLAAITLPGTGKASVAGDEPAQGFDALLAGLLPGADALASGFAAASGEAPLPVTVPDVTVETPTTAPADAVATLLASLPGTHALALPDPTETSAEPEQATAIDLSTPKGQSAQPVAAAPDRTPTTDDRHTVDKADRPLPQADADHRRGHPAATTASVPARADLPALPPTAAAPAIARRMERDAGLSEMTGAITAGQLPSPTTELPARQTVLAVAPALSTPAWSHAFSEQVLWAARADFQSASLTLNPPELGPIRIELQLNDTQALASFSSAQPEVRKAIDEALPMLKTLFAEAGLDLRQADVGSGDAQPRQGRDDQAGSGRTAGAPANPDPRDIAAPSPPRQSRGLLDTFA